MRRTSRLLITLFLALPVVVQAQFTYTTNAGGITITGYIGSGGEVTIPDTISGLPVTAIASHAFAGQTNLASVFIPSNVVSVGTSAFESCSNLAGVRIGSGVTNLGDFAFQLCTSLASISIPRNVARIGNYAFSLCTSLTNVVLTDSVATIGDIAFGSCTNLSGIIVGDGITNINSRAFAGCTQLTNIFAGAQNPFYSSADGVLFNKAQTTLLLFPGGKTGGYTIPSNVTMIGESAFFQSRLTTVVLSDAVTFVGDEAFFDSLNLVHIVIGRGITNLPYRAFGYCTNLPYVTLPTNVTSMAPAVFQLCTSLKGVFFCGSAPSLTSPIYVNATNAISYYLPDISGWGTAFGGRPTRLWNPQVQTGATNFGVQFGGFSLPITGTTNIPIVIEAATSLVASPWIPLQSCILTNGSVSFTDSNWINSPVRFYRIRSP